ncbi:unnamed protein product, partial [marine sediment metagenome]
MVVFPHAVVGADADGVSPARGVLRIPDLIVLREARTLPNPHHMKIIIGVNGDGRKGLVESR